MGIFLNILTPIEEYKDIAKSRFLYDGDSAYSQVLQRFRD